MSDKIFFSRRQEIAGEATAYLSSIGADLTDPTNMITALCHLGYLVEKPGKEEDDENPFILHGEELERAVQARKEV